MIADLKEYISVHWLDNKQPKKDVNDTGGFLSIWDTDYAQSE